MLKKILIANRGEIARRIIRTARRMGIATVAVYSDADARSLHVREADEAVHIGPSPAPESYLRGDRIIAAAKATGAEGIHPGYGFLAENADFSEAVGAAGIRFIGPGPEAMRALGGKAAAKEVAIKAGVPVVPGYQGTRQDVPSLGTEAKKIGYPVMIKAVAGGGGRGMRLVATEAELPELLASAQREAEGAFGDPRVLIEKVVERPRHIEVQVFGDSHGNVVHLFERDCTLQRRNQKVIEEAPAPGMSEALREQMCGAAVKLAKAVGYEGAGTVEFLVEGGTLGPEAKWYFIEMNTRLQVEHPVTEEITGLDLVEWQLRVAAGEKLPLVQRQIRMRGHAIEVRLCAEDPAKGFLPSVGRIDDFTFEADGSTRIESGVEAGSSVSPFYDSMVAKIIEAQPTRGETIDALRAALRSGALWGLQTNAAFLDALLADVDVREGRMDTGLIGREIARLTAVSSADEAIAQGALAFLDCEDNWTGSGRAAGSWDARDAFQIGGARRQTVGLTLDGAPISVEAEWRSGEMCVRYGTAEASTWPDHYHANGLLHHALREYRLARPVYDAAAVEDGNAGDNVRAPINGKVTRVFVSEGDGVAKGDRIAVVEAMKMEHILHAGRDGTIAKVAIKEGAQVNQGALIASLVEEA